MTVKVPTLSSSGWVVEMAEKADKLLSYFFVSEASQSELYAGTITSLPSYLQRYGNDEFELRSQLQLGLTRYLDAYFESANVSVVIKKGPEDDRVIDLEFELHVSDGGQQYSVGRLVSTLNNSIMKIIDLNENGVQD